MRLIDADKLWNALPADDGLLMYQVKRAIRDAPTVDAVDVVRCKDCARCKKGYCTIRKDSWGAALLVGEHDFCSYGERKEK